MRVDMGSGVGQYGRATGAQLDRVLEVGDLDDELGQDRPQSEQSSAESDAAVGDLSFEVSPQRTTGR